MARKETNNRGKSNKAGQSRHSGQSGQSGQSGEVRVIAGALKNSILRFSGDDSLRPTPSAVRKTLFNWLDTSISTARCLDLFAGTGALGFEAVSRGAEHVIMVERNRVAADAIRANALRLKVSNISVEHTHALNFLAFATSQTFDLVFLDPPYGADMVGPCLQVILEKNILRPNARIYVEMATDCLPEITHGLSIEKQKQQGRVAYYLLALD